MHARYYLLIASNHYGMYLSLNYPLLRIDIALDFLIATQHWLWAGQEVKGATHMLIFFMRKSSWRS